MSGPKSLAVCSQSSCNSGLLGDLFLKGDWPVEEKASFLLKKEKEKRNRWPGQGWQWHPPLVERQAFAPLALSKSTTGMWEVVK